MRVEVRISLCEGKSVPRAVILVAENEAEQTKLDLLGNLAKKEVVKVQGTMQLSDGYGEMYLAFPVKQPRPRRNTRGRETMGRIS